MENIIKEKLLTIKEVAELLHREESTIRKRIKKGQLPAHKLGRSWYLLESELLEWIKNT
jgi:excisionase family DNA binding protein